MKVRQKFLEEKDELRNYLAHINWDWLFLKGQLIFGLIILVVVVCFLLWGEN